MLSWIVAGSVQIHSEFQELVRMLKSDGDDSLSAPNTLSAAPPNTRTNNPFCKRLSFKAFIDYLIHRCRHIGLEKGGVREGQKHSNSKESTVQKQHHKVPSSTCNQKQVVHVKQEKDQKKRIENDSLHGIVFL
jgi:hypothetical protein